MGNWKYYYPYTSSDCAYNRVRDYPCGGYCEEKVTRTQLWDGSHDKEYDYYDHDIGDCNNCEFKCVRNKNKELRE